MKMSLGVALAAVLVGCSSSDPEPTASVLLEPPAVGQGVQFGMTTQLEPASEVEHCKFVTAPAEGMYINHDEVRYTSGSHHFLLYLTPYETIPTKRIDGVDVDTSGVFDCSDGVTNGWNITKLVGGSQNSNGDSMLSFPDNVAMSVPPGAVLLMNAHYINASPEPKEPEVRINLYTVPEDQVDEEGDMLFWYNLFIKVDGQSTSRATARCAIDQDITITNAQSHMHARGADYAAGRVVSGSMDTPLYTSTKWENVPVTKFDGGFPVEKDSVIEYWCDYDNPESHTVYQGPKSTDEMCMLIASYYPAHPRTSLCSSDPDDVQRTNYFGAEWVGDGTATCAETLTCLSGAGGSMTEFINTMSTCVTESDPAVSREMSDSVSCILDSLVKGKNALTECEAEFASCGAK